MAESTLARTGLTVFSAPSDQHPNRQKYNEELLKLENKVALFAQGAATSRPVSGLKGVFFWDDTNKRLEYDTGAGWTELGSVGGGGAGRQITVGTNATEGTSTRAARADHVHNLPVATETVSGAMSSADKAMLSNASPGINSNYLVKRDNRGSFSVPSPLNSSEVANRGFVEEMAGQLSSEGHMHPASHIYTGVLHPDRLPVASGNGLPGAITNAQYWLLQESTPNPTDGTLVKRRANGTADVARPISDYNAANKGYVDDSVLSRAPSRHTHGGSDIISAIDPSKIIGSDRAWAQNDAGSTWTTVAVRPDGLFCRYPSSIRYKENIRRYEFDPGTFAKLADGAIVYDRTDGTLIDEPGFLAEEVHDLYPKTVYTDGEGQIEGINFQMLVVPTVQAAQHAINTAQQALAEVARLREELGRTP